MRAIRTLTTTVVLTVTLSIEVPAADAYTF